MATVERDLEVGWARSGQEAAEQGEAEDLLDEAEAAFGRGDYLTAADILHTLRDGGFPCRERSDRLVEGIRSSLRDSDRVCFEHTLSTGLPPKPESGADAGVSVSWGERRVGGGPWTLSVLAGWLVVSAVFAVSGVGKDSFVVVPWGTWFLVYLGVFSVPALVVWLVGYGFMRRAQRRS